MLTNMFKVNSKLIANCVVVIALYENCVYLCVAGAS